MYLEKGLLILCLLYVYQRFGLALSIFNCFFKKQHLNMCVDADMLFLQMFTLPQECFKFQNKIQAPLMSMANITGFNGVRMLQLRSSENNNIP